MTRMLPLIMIALGCAAVPPMEDARLVTQAQLFARAVEAAQRQDATELARAQAILEHSYVRLRDQHGLPFDQAYTAADVLCLVMGHAPSMVEAGGPVRAVLVSDGDAVADAWTEGETFGRLMDIKVRMQSGHAPRELCGSLELKPVPKDRLRRMF